VDTSGKHGGHLQHSIMLTPNTAKEICMMSRSPVASDVRKYFIAVETALENYKNHIIESMKQKIEQLEANQRPTVSYKSGIIYVFRAPDADGRDLFKVGKTIASRKRFETYNTGLANKLEPVMVYETKNTDQVESCVKNLLKQTQYRTGKEVYEVDIDIIKYVIESCEKYVCEVKNIIKKRKASNDVNTKEKLVMIVKHD